MAHSDIIGHLDADCFYASAERLRDPFLLNKAVGVLGNQGACVIAKSYEMRDAGVKTGMPIWDAKKVCPDGVYIKRDFRWYEVVSRRMLDVVRSFCPEVEYYSIDEFFFRAQPRRGVTHQQLAEQLREAIWHEVGIPVTVGIARSKTLAKLISDTAKPHGALALLDRDAQWLLLDHVPVTEVCGIGKRRGARLASHDINTALDYAFADRRFIRKLLTIVGEQLWYELNGEAVYPLHLKRPAHKMISRGGSIGRVTNNPDFIYGWIVRNVERLVEELEYHQVCPEVLEVWIEHRGGKWNCCKVPMSTPSARFDLILDSAKWGMQRAWQKPLWVHRMHLIATKLRWPGSMQLGLFDVPNERAEKVAKVKREVNEKCGRFALRSAATLFLGELYKDSAWGYEICDVRDKMCF